MAKVTLEIPDDAWDGIKDALATRRGRPDKVANPAFDNAKPESDSNLKQIDNPETKEQFLVRSVIEYIKGEYTAWAKDQNLAAAKAAVDAAVAARVAEVEAALKTTVEATVA